MPQVTWLDYITALGAMATPVLVLVLTGIGWRFRLTLERRFSLEDRLREDRVETYNEILEPFIMLLMSEAAWKADPANKNVDKNELASRKMLSLGYRSKAFRLSLVGSDAVVRAYNNLFQYFYQRGEKPLAASEQDAQETMSFLGRFLLEIRRSMGNEATELDHWEMLEWFLTDARRLRGGQTPEKAVQLRHVG